MTSKQKKQISNFVQGTFKVLGCSFLFLGMTMALGISINPHMELYAYMLLFVGTILIMIHSFRSNDHMFLLVSSAGFVLVGNSFLDTETAIMILRIDDVISSKSVSGGDMMGGMDDFHM